MQALGTIAAAAVGRQWKERGQKFVVKGREAEEAAEDDHGVDLGDAVGCVRRWRERGQRGIGGLF